MLWSHRSFGDEQQNTTKGLLLLAPCRALRHEIKCCMPTISCTQLPVQQYPGLPVQFVLCFLFQPWLLRCPQDGLCWRSHKLATASQMGRCSHASPSIHRNVFHASIPGKHFPQFPAEGSDENLKSTHGKGRANKKAKPKPKLLLWIQPSFWSKRRRTEASSVPLDWLILHPKRHSPTPLMSDKKTRL